MRNRSSAGRSESPCDGHVGGRGVVDRLSGTEDLRIGPLTHIISIGGSASPVTIMASFRTRSESKLELLGKKGEKCDFDYLPDGP